MRQPKKIESPAESSQEVAEIIMDKPAKKAPSTANAESSIAEFNIELQYAGRSIPFSEILGKALENCGNEKTNLYIKPEENRVYFVSGDSIGSFEI